MCLFCLAILAHCNSRVPGLFDEMKGSSGFYVDQDGCVYHLDYIYIFYLQLSSGLL